jgi:hypothetical protein
MEAFKIAIYEQRNGTGTFAPFHSLSHEEADRLFQSLKRKLKLPEQLDAVHVIEHIERKNTLVKGIDATQDDFDLMRTLQTAGLEVSEQLFLNWYRFDRMDEIRVDDLCRSFCDIWYTSSDDLDILHASLNWILSIHHSGTVSFLRLA